MPFEFFDDTNEDIFMNPWARYMMAGIEVYANLMG